MIANLFVKIFEIKPYVIGQIAPKQIVANKLTIIFRGCKVVADKLGVKKCPITLAKPFQIIGVLPIRRVSDQTVLDGVAVNITAKMQKVRFCLNQLCLIYTLKE